MRVLITGAAGQDGTILSTMLQREGAETIGIVKPGTLTGELLRYAPATQIVECDLADTGTLRQVIETFEPNQIFNFGGISSIMDSVRNPEMTHEVNVVAVESILASMDVVQRRGQVRPKLLAAASGTIFEGVDRAPQTESMIPVPRTPYAQSKARVIELLDDAREKNGLFVCAAILYNHESPLRGAGFVTRKITMAVARIAAGRQDALELGDLEVARDWGWAPDYVRGMRLMLEAGTSKDYVLATGISHRLSLFVQKAFAAVGIFDWMNYVVSTPNGRPGDTNLLVGDASRAYRELDWRHTVDFDAMAAAMVRFDQELLERPDTLWLDF